jgi:hypothetical protein
MAAAAARQESGQGQGREQDRDSGYAAHTFTLRRHVAAVNAVQSYSVL